MSEPAYTQFALQFKASTRVCDGKVRQEALPGRRHSKHLGSMRAKERVYVGKKEASRNTLSSMVRGRWSRLLRLFARD